MIAMPGPGDREAGELLDGHVGGQREAQQQRQGRGPDGQVDPGPQEVRPRRRRETDGRASSSGVRGQNSRASFSIIGRPSTIEIRKTPVMTSGAGDRLGEVEEAAAAGDGHRRANGDADHAEHEERRDGPMPGEADEDGGVEPDQRRRVGHAQTRHDQAAVEERRGDERTPRGGAVRTGARPTRRPPPSRVPSGERWSSLIHRRSARRRLNPSSMGAVRPESQRPSRWAQPLKLCSDGRGRRWRSW